MTKDKKIYYSVLSLIAALIFFALIANIKRVLNGEFSVYDYGIFLQAAYELAQGHLNPFLSVRDINLFNDHFFPILFLSGLWVKIWAYKVYSLEIFEWLWFVAYFLMGLKLIKHEKVPVKIAGVLFLVFSKGLLEGVYFAVHPGVWAAMSWLIIGYGIMKKDYKSVFWAALSLFLFRESFIFSVFALSVGLFFIKSERKHAAILLAVSILWAYIVFVLRPQLLGPVMKYGGSSVSGLLSHPFQLIWEALLSHKYKITFKIMFPYFIPVGLILWKRKYLKIEPISLMLLLFLLSPHYLIHLLSGRFHFQYSAAAVTPIVGAILGSGVLNYLWEEKRKLFILVAILPIVSGSTFYTKFVKIAFHKYENGSRWLGYSYHEAMQVKEIVNNLPAGEKVVTGSKAATLLIEPNILNIYGVEEHLRRHHVFDYLYLEHRQFPDKMDKLKEACIPFREEVVFKGHDIELWKGKFDRNCFEFNYP